MASRLAALEAQVHRLGILFEGFQDKLRLILEGQEAGFLRLETKLDSRTDELARRLDTVEAILLQNSVAIQQLQVAALALSDDVKQSRAAIEENRKAIEETRAEVRSVRAELGRIAHGLETKADAPALARVASRVTRLEKKVGLKK